MSNSIAANRSTLRDFLGSVATIKGDLSNITAPPFVFADYSTVELPQYFADHPSLFVAPAFEEDVEKRALLVLKNFLASLKNQQYAGRREEDGVKKPINAFLGELFIGSWKDDKNGETRLISEQVGHHPPVTACYLWNQKCGVSSEGFTQQAITFNGNVLIKQQGYAITHIDRYDEYYLIPLPSVKVKGVLTGTPYPELEGKYSILSTTGVISEIRFEGKGLFGGGSKHGFTANVFRSETPSKTIYTVKGQWNGNFSIQDARTGDKIDTSDMGSEHSIPITVEAQSKQDPWESRRAWGSVIKALSQGDMKGTVEAKSDIEDGQRRLRQEEEAQNRTWQHVFFQKQDQDPLFDRLSAADKASFTIDHTVGMWKVNRDAVDSVKKPYHGNLLPTGQIAKEKDANTKSDAVQMSSNRPKLNAEQQWHGVQIGASQGSDQGSNGKSDKHVDESVNGNANPTKSVKTGNNGDNSGLKVDELTDVQVEEMLRAKYSSAPR
jgi:hypothetical protein